MYAHVQIYLLILWSTKASLVYKFPSLLNQPPINLKWPASSFGHFLHFPYWGWFQISPRQILSLQTNTYYLFFIVYIPTGMLLLGICPVGNLFPPSIYSSKKVSQFLASSAMYKKACFTLYSESSCSAV